MRLMSKIEEQKVKHLKRKGKTTNTEDPKEDKWLHSK